MLLGIPVAWIGILVGLFKTLGGMSGDIQTAASQITAGVVLALWFTIIGQSVALVGLTLLLIALLRFKVREPWILKWGRVLMLPWLILIPVGTVAGILMLGYFSRHREEFLMKGGAPNESTRANSHPTERSSLTSTAQ